MYKTPDPRSHPIPGVGALIGPTIGSAVWRLRHRHRLAVIDEMDREFFKRIAKNRVDASLQSPTNPVPDYYGEHNLSIIDAVAYSPSRRKNWVTPSV